MSRPLGHLSHWYTERPGAGTDVPVRTSAEGNVVDAVILHDGQVKLRPGVSTAVTISLVEHTAPPCVQILIFHAKHFEAGVDASDDFGFGHGVLPLV